MGGVEGVAEITKEDSLIVSVWWSVGDVKQKVLVMKESNLIRRQIRNIKIKKNERRSILS